MSSFIVLLDISVSFMVHAFYSKAGEQIYFILEYYVQKILKYLLSFNLNPTVVVNSLNEEQTNSSFAPQRLNRTILKMVELNSIDKRAIKAELEKCH